MCSSKLCASAFMEDQASKDEEEFRIIKNLFHLLVLFSQGGHMGVVLLFRLPADNFLKGRFTLGRVENDIRDFR